MPENIYKTLDGVKFDLGELPEQDKKIHKAVQEFLKREPKPGWCEVANFWADLVVEAYTECPEVTEMAIYKICQDTESRRGIEQGRIKPPEGYDWLGDLGITDKGKMLFVFYSIGRAYALDKSSLPIIPDKRLDICFYLLKAKGILPTAYRFKFSTDGQHSDQLHSDIDFPNGLLGSGDIKIEIIDDSRSAQLGLKIYSITSRGIFWILDHIPVHEPLYKNIAQQIAERIKEWESRSDEQLLRAALLNQVPATTV